MAERLIAGGWMQEAGLAEVAAAQADGRWDAAASDVVEAAYPDDFIVALNAAPQSARNTLAGYDAKNRHAITYRLAAAKQPETRAKRIEEFIAKGPTEDEVRRAVTSYLAGTIRGLEQVGIHRPLNG